MPFAVPRIDGKPLIIRTYMNLKTKTSIHVCMCIHIYIYIYIYIYLYCCIKFRFLSWSGFGSCYPLSLLGGWGQASDFPLESDANPIRQVDGCRHPLKRGRGMAATKPESLKKTRFNMYIYICFIKLFNKLIYVFIYTYRVCNEGLAITPKREGRWMPPTF